MATFCLSHRFGGVRILALSAILLGATLPLAAASAENIGRESGSSDSQAGACQIATTAAAQAASDFKTANQLAGTASTGACQCETWQIDGGTQWQCLAPWKVEG